MITRIKYDRFTGMYTAERKWFFGLFWTEWFIDPQDGWVMRGQKATRKDWVDNFIKEMTENRS